VGRILGIDGIVLAAFASIKPVWCAHLKNFDSSPLQVSHQTCTISTRTLYPNALNKTECVYRTQHRFVTVPGRRKKLATQYTIMRINDSSYMQIFMRINSTHNRRFLLIHCLLSSMFNKLWWDSTQSYCLDKTVKRQAIRPFFGHMQRRGETTLQDVPG
jgi:hypothetical protein